MFRNFSGDCSEIFINDSTSSNNLNEEILYPYLTQYHHGINRESSDDSDFQDTSYEIDLLYDSEKQREIEELRNHEKIISQTREAIVQKYFNTHKNKMKSIFNLKGIKFNHFNHKLISFIFTPSAFSKKYICVHRKYYISLKYKKKWWSLKRFQVPNKSEVLEFFEHTFVDDKGVMKVLHKIYNSLVRVTRIQIEDRRNKFEAYLLGKEVWFNSDDEKLLLTPDELKARKEKINFIWSRMLPPKS